MPFLEVRQNNTNDLSLNPCFYEQLDYINSFLSYDNPNAASPSFIFGYFFNESGVRSNLSGLMCQSNRAGNH